MTQSRLMPKKRVFISFDYDHDDDLRNLLVGQAANPDSPFEIADWSLKESRSDWVAEVTKRIRNCHVVIVIVGKHMASANGVKKEIAIARQQGVRMFGLRGRPGAVPDGFPKVYRWTWDNLKALIGGAR